MTGLDEKLMERESSLDFGKHLLERSNLSEILNVEEVLERRYQELSLEPCIAAMELNFSRVIYVPNEDSHRTFIIIGRRRGTDRGYARRKLHIYCYYKGFTGK